MEVANGIYDVAEYEDDFGPLRAFADTAEAKLVGFYYDPQGYKHIVVSARSDVRQNPIEDFEATMTTAKNYYLLALRDYEDWQEKWWREAIQNSVDARANNIICKERIVDDDTIEISCDDNGEGMSIDTFLNVFLARGGTTKTAGTTTGGFGKAKELLVLPWIEWRMESQDWYAIGAGENTKGGEAPYRDGTKLTVLMNRGDCTNVARAAGFIQKSYLPRVKFLIINAAGDGAEITADLKKGKAIRELGDDDATLYYAKKKPQQHAVYIRANGLLMFELPYWTDVPGSIVVELNKSSVQLLTANRDGFRHRVLQNSVQSFVQELASEQTQALRKKQGIIDLVFRGEEGTFVAERKASVLKDKLLDGVGYTAPNNAGSLSSQQIEEIVEIFAEEQEQRKQEQKKRKILDFDTTPKTAETLIKSVDFKGGNQVEVALAQFAWTPDFYLVNEIEGYKVPNKLYPEKMTVPVRKLIRYWVELCRYVMILLKSDRHFGVGFIISEDVQAQYARHDGTDWLMINPFKGSHFGGSIRHAAEDFDIFDISKSDQAEHIYSLAVHECTHMVNGLMSHDSDFAAFLTNNFTTAFDGLQYLPAIKRGVLVVERETAKRLKAQRKLAQHTGLPDGVYRTKFTKAEMYWAGLVLGLISDREYYFSSWFNAGINFVEGKEEDYRAFIGHISNFIREDTAYQYRNSKDAQKAAPLLGRVIHKLVKTANIGQ